MFKYWQVSDVVFMKSGPVDGVGLEIVKCYGDAAVPVPYSNTAVTGLNMNNRCVVKTGHPSPPSGNVNKHKAIARSVRLM